MLISTVKRYNYVIAKLRSDQEIQFGTAMAIQRTSHSVKRVRIWSFFCSVFSRIQFECGKIRTRKNSVSEHFSHSVSSEKLNILSVTGTKKLPVINIRKVFKSIRL